MNQDLCVASLSDVHLGHPNTPTSAILRELDETFPDSSELSQLNYLFIVGDLFDRAMMFNDRPVAEVLVWMYRLLKRCQKHDVCIRILEGTPSHDRRQSKALELANLEGGYGVDLKYVDTLSIEYHPRYDTHLLYVPDEWAPETDDVWRQVTALLDRHGLEKVDFTLLHGAMEYQLPDVATGPRHSTDRYLSITRCGVFVGHVHQASQRQHLFAHGSFSRLSHGEEDAKGHWRCVFQQNGDYQATFVENTKAQLYRTLKIYDETIDEALAAMEVAGTLPDGSHIRIEANRGHPILHSLDPLRQRYPKIRWTTKTRESASDDVQSNLLVDLRSQYTPIQLTAENLSEILLARLQTTGLSTAVYARAQTRLGALL